MYILLDDFDQIVSTGQNKTECLLPIFTVELCHEHETKRVMVNGSMLPHSYEYDHTDDEVMARVLREYILPKINEYGYRLFKQI